MLVSVPMVDIRVVGMCVNYRVVPMRMRVRVRVDCRRITRTVHMLVMLVVHVRMRVLHRLVGVSMYMSFRNVQPYTERHQSASSD